MHTSGIIIIIMGPIIIQWTLRLVKFVNPWSILIDARVETDIQISEASGFRVYCTYTSRGRSSNFEKGGMGRMEENASPA